MFTGFHGNVYDKMMMIMMTMIVYDNYDNHDNCDDNNHDNYGNYDSEDNHDSLMIMVINIIMIIMIILRTIIIIIMILTRKIQTHRCGSKKDNRLDFLYLRAPFVSQTPLKSQQTKRSPVRGTNHPSPVKIVTSSLHWWKCWMASSCFTILLYTSNCLR